MNISMLQISLLVTLLTIIAFSIPAQADCQHEELCEAQLRVDELHRQIVAQHKAIQTHRQSLNVMDGWHKPARLYERLARSVDVISRYLRIGTLESRLLVAYNKLGSVKVAIRNRDTICRCGEVIQLSAGFTNSK